MFEDMRFRHSFVNLVMDPGVPLSWMPYGISHHTLIKIGLDFEQGSLKGLSPRHRAIKTALELIETNLIPDDGKISLHTAALGYATKHHEFDFSYDLLLKARIYLSSRGLAQRLPWDDDTAD